MNGHWVLDGLVIEGEHAMERVYKCMDLEAMRMLEYVNISISGIRIYQEPCCHQKAQCDIVARIGTLIEPRQGTSETGAVKYGGRSTIHPISRHRE